MINKLKIMLVLLLGVFACGENNPKQKEIPSEKTTASRKSKQEKMSLQESTSSSSSELEQESLPLDSSWYIHSGLYLQEGNYTTLPPSNKVTINGIGLPNKGCDPKAKDDIFIIYKDGTYYSSRDGLVTGKDNTPTKEFGDEYQTLQDGKVQNQKKIYVEDEKKYVEKLTPIASLWPGRSRIVPGSRLDIIPNEKIYLSYKTGTDTIIFLYTTNPYDDDPPPGKINTTNTSKTTYNTIVKTNIKDVLSANHNITIGSDITIIINSSGLDSNGYIPPYTLKYSEVGISSRNRIIPIGGELFSPSPIFFDNPAFPADSNNVYGAESIIRNFHPSNYAYINLRPKNFPDELLPHVSESGELIIKSIIFELFDSLDKPISSLVETIGHSNDPNIIKATKICKDTNTNQEYVQYYCTFQNIFRKAAKILKVRFKLPEGLIRTSLVISDSYANGIEIPNPAITPLSDNYIEIKWPPTLQINACANNSESGIIRFKFCVKKDMNSNLDLTEVMALEVTNAYTSFTTNGRTMEYPLVYKDLPCTLENKYDPESYAKININCNREFQDCDCN